MRIKTTVFILLFFILASCMRNNENNNHESLTGTDSANVRDITEVTDQSMTTMAIPGCESTKVLNYSSFDELRGKFFSENSQLDFGLEYGKYFDVLIEKSKIGDLRMYIPEYCGNTVNLSEANGNIICVFSQEKFNLPWIWYYCSINDVRIVFEICYLDVLESEFTEDNISYGKLSEILSPAYTTASSFGDNDKETYNYVIEKDITLYNGKTVAATVYDYNENNYWHRLNYRFIYDNIVVSVWNCDESGYEFFNDAFISSLSFRVT